MTEPLRRSMVAIIAGRGITDARVLAALEKIDRAAFVGAEQGPFAYDDRPLPIGCGQTISQPFIVAYMTERLGLSGVERVLEVGTGSGYQTSILAELAAEVRTVEVEPELAGAARPRLQRLGYENIRFKVGNGLEGWPDAAPFDRILVTASLPGIPESLLGQLADGGSLVAPIGLSDGQHLIRVVRSGSRFASETLMPVVFVLAHGTPNA